MCKLRIVKLSGFRGQAVLEQTNWEREQSDAVVGTRLAELEAENRELRKHYTLRGGARSLFRFDAHT